MCSAVLYCAVLCCAVLCCVVLYCAAVLCCTVLCCAVLCCAVLCCAVLCCAVLCCAVLCCAVYIELLEQSLNIMQHISNESMYNSDQRDQVIKIQLYINLSIIYQVSNVSMLYQCINAV